MIAIIAAFGPSSRRPPWVGLDLMDLIWPISYALYLLAVFFPQSSTFPCILAPLFPLLGAFALPRARWYRWGLVVLFLVLQVGWLLICWGIDGRDWTPP